MRHSSSSYQLRLEAGEASPAEQNEQKKIWISNSVFVQLHNFTIGFIPSYGGRRSHESSQTESSRRYRFPKQYIMMIKMPVEKGKYLMMGLRFLSSAGRRVKDSVRNVGIIAHIDAGNN